MFHISDRSPHGPVGITGTRKRPTGGTVRYGAARDLAYFDTLGITWASGPGKTRLSCSSPSQRTR